MDDPGPLSSLLSDKVLQERSRLLILSYLVSRAGFSAPFMQIQKDLEMTRGNLSIQIKKLQEARYLAVEKSFKDNKPLTTVTITDRGSVALRKYLYEMNRIIQTIDPGP